MTTSIPPEQTKSDPAKATKKAGASKRRAPAAASKAKPVRKALLQKKAAPAAQGSKTAKVLDLLKRSGGVTLKELVKATGWQAHSVRGFISGVLSRKMGLNVISTKAEDGVRRYSLKS